MQASNVRGERERKKPCKPLTQDTITAGCLTAARPEDHPEPIWALPNVPWTFCMGKECFIKPMHTNDAFLIKHPFPPKIGFDHVADLSLPGKQLHAGFPGVASDCA